MKSFGSFENFCKFWKNFRLLKLFVISEILLKLFVSIGNSCKFLNFTIFDEYFYYSLVVIFLWLRKYKRFGTSVMEGNGGRDKEMQSWGVVWYSYTFSPVGNRFAMDFVIRLTTVVSLNCVTSAGAHVTRLQKVTVSHVSRAITSNLFAQIIRRVAWNHERHVTHLTLSHH